MNTRFPCLSLYGGLLSSELIEKISDGNALGQKPSNFGLDAGTYLMDEIASAWSSAKNFWQGFNSRLERLDSEDPATSITRDQWMIPFFSLLGYRINYQSRAAIVEGTTYAISHREGENEDGLPIHIVGARNSLDKRPETGRPRLAPHSLVQEYLNRTDHLWGIISNGKTLRILRNSQLLRRQSYIEFDLEQMMTGDKFADFVLLYRILHRTRLPHNIEDAHESIIENYYQITLEQGGRVRDHLRDGVEEAMKIVASSLLDNPKNEELRKNVLDNHLSSKEFYRELLRLIYRILFLMVAEERNLLTDNQNYSDYYSISRLRKIAEEPSAYNQKTDLWSSLQITFHLFHNEKFGKYLKLPPLNGKLFSLRMTKNLNGTILSNNEFLSVLWHLSMYKEEERSPWHRINYSALDVEELGSVYESLLDFHPVFQTNGDKISFDLVTGMERKSTGSYYTPPELVNELIGSSVYPLIKERVKDTDNKEKALLSLKICDPACGSGHFLLAASRAVGKELAKIRTGDDEPGPSQQREAVRDVISYCIYGVDKNPLAVDLCKVALWLESHTPGKPLTFLDHRILDGDSLVGVFDLNVLSKGIPDNAFKPVTGDDKKLAGSLKNMNRDERKGQGRLPFSATEEVRELSSDFDEIERLSNDSPENIKRKEEILSQIQKEGSRWYTDETACSIWTSAFFVEKNPENDQEQKIPTSHNLRNFLETKFAPPRLKAQAWVLANSQSYFHWPLEFPEVFENGGFDVVLCNPPWERIKLQEKEFFANRDIQIASAPNQSARRKKIKELEHSDPSLYKEYRNALHYSEALSQYLRNCSRFSLTARGDINTYAVFAELFLHLLNSTGRAGVVVPTGLATDNTTKDFFAYLVEKDHLASLFDFENRKKIFQDVDSRTKFSLLTIKGEKFPSQEPPKFSFFLTQTEQLKENLQVFELSKNDFNRINPNTKTCPLFRTRPDAELTRKIYEKFPVLVNEESGENPWKIRFSTMFHMSNDSGYFRTSDQLEDSGYHLVGNLFVKNDEVYLPLYEAKMIWQYDHRFGSYEGVKSRTSTHLPTPSELQYKDPYYVSQPWYWVNSAEVKNRMKNWQNRWLLGFRDVTNATNERTVILCQIPIVAVGHKAPLILSHIEKTGIMLSLLLNNFNNIIFDFIARQKIGGTSLAYFILKQLPVLKSINYDTKIINLIIANHIELSYYSYEEKRLADDIWNEADKNLRQSIKKQWQENQQETGGHSKKDIPEWLNIHYSIFPKLRNTDEIPLPPFVWDENRRAKLRAEIDAYYAKLYGLTEEELRYILDPEDIYGPEFPGESFRVLKQKEIKKFGEYRTKRLVLEAWDKMKNKKI